MRPIFILFILSLFTCCAFALNSEADVSKNRLSLNTCEKKSRRKRFSIIPNPNSGFFHTSNLIRSQLPNFQQQQFLVTQHNLLRSTVPATNMRMIRWDDILARSAQRHADTCDFNHSSPRNRMNSGENIWASTKSNYQYAVQMWFNEVFDQRCHCQHAYRHCCGHYTQVVWADTKYLGCGFSECKNIKGAPGRRYILVCQYFPNGNVVHVGSYGVAALPAFRWQNATHGPCTECPHPFLGCLNGLCL